MIRLVLTSGEVKLLDDIDYVGHGDIFDIGSSEEKPSVSKTVCEEFAALIRELRHHKHFDKVVIHDGLPKYAEISGQTNGRRYTKKIKF